MHKITKFKIGEVKKQHYEEYIKRCSEINSEAATAGRFRSGRHSSLIIETTYKYVKEFFLDILDVERNALKGRILFLRQDDYFNELISYLRTILLSEFKNVLDEQFLSTSSAYKAGRYQNPLKDPTIQKTIIEYSDRIHRLTMDNLNAMREEFKQERSKRILEALPKIFSAIKAAAAKKLIGL